jgi:hypothetical protein
MPWVVGKIQGVTLPFGPYTATQLGVLLGGAWLLVQTFRFWSHLGPAGLVFLALPPAAAWAARHARIEGRSPVRAIGGYLTLLACHAAAKLPHGVRTVTVSGWIRVARPTYSEAACASKEQQAAPAPTALQILLAACAGTSE